MKQTATDRAIAKVDAEIAVLQNVRVRLVEAADSDEPESAEPKVRKPRRKRGMPATMPVGEARPIA